MRTILSLIRIQWLTHVSYRMNVLLSLLGLVALFVPIWLVADALQPVVAESIADEGEVYFGFLLVGIIVHQMVTITMSALPNAISRGIMSGTLESLLSTPARLGRLLVGLLGYETLWGGLRGGLLLLAYAGVGGMMVPSGIPVAFLALVLMMLAHLPVGLVAAAMIMVFRTAGPLVQGAVAAVGLLGGVFYSTSVIPEVVQPLAAVIPLTYGLRVFRRSLLSGEPLPTLVPDLLILTAFTVVLLAAGIALFRASLIHARRAGTLAQY
jgi:ABC-2 type transport system permease protein